MFLPISSLNKCSQHLSLAFLPHIGITASKASVNTLNSAYNKKKYVEILLCYRQLFIKGDVFIGEWGIFGAEVFLCYSQFFIKGNFVIGGAECIWSYKHLCSFIKCKLKYVNATK